MFRAASVSPGRQSFSTRARLWLQAAVWILVTSLQIGACCAAVSPRLIEVRDESRTYVGKLIARDSEKCYLIDSFGVMSRLPVSRLQSFKVVADSYQTSSPGEFRQQLLNEFAGYEVQSSTHYAVVARKGRARAFTAMFEEIYRQVQGFYSVRGFEITAPEHLFVSVVLGTEEEFREYCGRDEVPWAAGLRGYYSLNTNRVVLFDDPGLLKTAGIKSSRNEDSTTSVPQPVDATSVVNSGSGALAPMLRSVTSETASTIVHEATHQVGHNIGIHSRIGQAPTWVIEGLATVLEAPGVRTRDKASAAEKVNAERLNWYQVEYQSRRQPGDLAKMIAADDMFRNQTLDAYSSAWALTYFMTENPARARLFVRYLKKLTERDGLTPYSAEDRLRDFQAVFGDISRLEVEFMRSMDRMETP